MRILWFLSGFATILSVIALVLSAFALITIVSDEDESQESQSYIVDRGEFAVDMVLEALELYEDQGREETVRFYNTPESTNGEWYVFIIDESDEIIAHATPDLLGEDLKGDLFVGADGYRFGEAILEATDRGHWVDYLFENPATGNQEYKHSWLVKRDGLIFGSGWYQVLPKSG